MGRLWMTRSRCGSICPQARLSTVWGPVVHSRSPRFPLVIPSGCGYIGLTRSGCGWICGYLVGNLGSVCGQLPPRCVQLVGGFGALPGQPWGCRWLCTTLRSSDVQGPVDGEIHIRVDLAWNRYGTCSSLWTTGYVSDRTRCAAPSSHVPRAHDHGAHAHTWGQARARRDPFRSSNGAAAARRPDQYRPPCGRARVRFG